MYTVGVYVCVCTSEKQRNLTENIIFIPKIVGTSLVFFRPFFARCRDTVIVSYRFYPSSISRAWRRRSVGGECAIGANARERVNYAPGNSIQPAGDLSEIVKADRHEPTAAAVHAHLVLGDEEQQHEPDRTTGHQANHANHPETRYTSTYKLVLCISPSPPFPEKNRIKNRAKWDWLPDNSTGHWSKCTLFVLFMWRFRVSAGYTKSYVFVELRRFLYGVSPVTGVTWYSIVVSLKKGKWCIEIISKYIWRILCLDSANRIGVNIEPNAIWWSLAISSQIDSYLYYKKQTSTTIKIMDNE